MTGTALQARGSHSVYSRDREEQAEPWGKEAGSTLPLSLLLASEAFFFFPLSVSALLCTEQSCVRLESFHTN